MLLKTAGIGCGMIKDGALPRERMAVGIVLWDEVGTG